MVEWKNSKQNSTIWPQSRHVSRVFERVKKKKKSWALLRNVVKGVHKMTHTEANKIKDEVTKPLNVYLKFFSPERFHFQYKK